MSMYVLGLKLTVEWMGGFKSTWNSGRPTASSSKKGGGITFHLPWSRRLWIGSTGSKICWFRIRCQLPWSPPLYSHYFLTLVCVSRF